MTIKILGVYCSENPYGKTAELFEKALASAQRSGAKIETYVLAGRVRAGNGSLSTEIAADLAEVTAKVLEADGVIIATPVHWYGPSVLAKTFVDRVLTPLEMQNFRCEGKAATVIAVCDDDGGSKTCGDILMPLIHMGFAVPPYGAFYHNTAMASRSEKGWMELDADILGQSVVELARRMKNWPEL